MHAARFIKVISQVHVIFVLSTVAGGSRLASEVRESSVVFKSGSSQTCLGAVASLRELGAAI